MNGMCQVGEGTTITTRTKNNETRILFNAYLLYGVDISTKRLQLIYFIFD